jgi:hypothetical protein
MSQQRCYACGEVIARLDVPGWLRLTYSLPSRLKFNGAPSKWACGRCPATVRDLTTLHPYRHGPDDRACLTCGTTWASGVEHAIA